jgi:Fic family protein
MVPWIINNEEGVFRENDEIYVVNYSNSEVVHTPPKHQDIEGLINELCDFFNKDQKYLYIHH